MTETTERTLPIDAHVISLNETDHYCILEKDRPFIKEIRGIYFYDANEHTYCCEMTPSYYLRHIRDEVILTDEGAELSEAAKDAIFQEYEYCGGEDIYVHCQDIDAAVKKSGRFEYHHYGETGVSYEDSSYDEQIEGLREHFSANPPF